MPVQLITYDLSLPKAAYTELDAAIKGLGPWQHCFGSVWIVSTAQSSFQVRDVSLQCIDHNDKLVVLELKGDWAAYRLAPECSDWLKANL